MEMLVVEQCAGRDDESKRPCLGECPSTVWLQQSRWFRTRNNDPNTCSLLSKFVASVIPNVLQMTSSTIVNYSETKGVSFQKFIYNILMRTQLSSLSLFLSLYYINRLLFNHSAVSVTNGCEYRLFVTGLILANKFLDDKTFCNRTWATITKIDIREINMMEREFLSLLRYCIFVNEHQLRDWISKVEKMWIQTGCAI